MNCQTWTRDSPSNDALRETPESALPQEALDLIHPRRWFDMWRLFPLDGEPVGYYADRHGWYLMCPASEGFQEHLHFWIVDMYAKRFGADGVYLDQAGAALAKPCYNLDQGHGDIGDWGMGNTELLRRCVEEARRIDADFILAIEGAGDALGQYADLHLISCLCTNPEVYHYTFPDHILISGFSNASHLDWQQRVTRQRIKPWLHPGRFMDTVGLTVSDERVRANWTICDRKGSRAIVFAIENEQHVEGATCTLALPDGRQEPRSLHIFDYDGGVRADGPDVADGRLTFRVPPSLISAGLLTFEVEKRHYVDVWQELPIDETGTDDLTLRAANLGPDDQDVTLALSTDAPPELGAERLSLPVSAGGAAAVTVPVAGVGELPASASISIDASWEGGSRQVAAHVRPLLLNGGLDLNESGTDVPDQWSAGGTADSFPRGLEDGAVRIKGQPEEYQYIIQHVPLQPLREYYFAGRIKRSASTEGISIAVVEFVGERGLRVHRLGGEADLPAGEWQRFETTFTTGESFRDAAVYLYNTHTDLTGWYDDIELRPAARE